MLPLLAGVLGSGIGSAALEAIGHAIAGSPTEAEARQRVAPLFYNEVAKLMAQGVSMPDAEKQANEAVSGHIKDEMSKSNLPDWAGGMLGIVGGIGGWAAGAKLAGKGLARMASKAVAGEAGAGAAKAASLADAAIEDPAKKIAAGAVAEGSGKAAEGAAKVTPMSPKKFTPAQEGGMEEMGESAAMNTPKEEMGEYALKGEAYGPFPTKTKVGSFSIDAPSSRNQHGMEFRMRDGMSGEAPVPTDYSHGMRGGMPTAGDAGVFKVRDGMSGEAPVPTDYSHGMRGGMPTAGDAGAFKVREGVGNSVPLTSDYGESMGPFPSVRRIRADGTRGQDSIDRSMRTARNRNRGVFDELDAEKQAQIEAMNASGRGARKPAYHSRDDVDSAVRQDDLDNLVFRLGR